MEVKENEIRIGNWFKHKDDWSYRQPKRDFKEFDFQWNDSDWYSIGECTMSLDVIEPIPLTEQWLLDLGFTHEYDDWELGSFHLDSNFCFNTISKDVKVYFVHQLQNWYYLYGGEELTLKSQ